MNYTYEQVKFLASSGIIEFGPPLSYQEICVGYTVEKMTLCQYISDGYLQMVLLRGSELTRARVEGTLYRLSDEEIVELDRRRGVGVQCERKQIAVYLPYFMNGRDMMMQVVTYAYIGYNAYWMDRAGNYLRDRAMHLAPRRPDNERFLNNRYCFTPSPVTIRPVYNKIVDGDGMRKLSEAEQRLLSVKDRIKQSIFSFKHRFSNFLNDDS